MKIEITIEVGPNGRGEEPNAKWLLSWLEKHHYFWQSATAIVDGDTVFDWEQGRATPEQRKQMRREVVRMKMGLPGVLAPRMKEERLGKDYREIIAEYDADPDAEWVKKLRKSIRAGERRTEKQREEVAARKAEHEATEAQKLALMRDLIKDEDIQQKVRESQGEERISIHRIRVMVEARIEGSANEDPTPTTPAEEALWKRICRAAESQAQFALPKRFYMFTERRGQRQISFDF